MHPMMTTPERVCRWCAMQLAPGSQPPTMAICPKCYVLMTLDMPRRLPERRREA
jgi:hypothetical protein